MGAGRLVLTFVEKGDDFVDRQVLRQVAGKLLHAGGRGTLASEIDRRELAGTDGARGRNFGEGGTFVGCAVGFGRERVGLKGVVGGPVGFLRKLVGRGVENVFANPGVFDSEE
ncbi:MAG: hypothetical protein WA771_04735 [Chthoniobacterales bacterium]